ncbi:MAG: DNA adenine methylase [Bacteroidales bacterium]|nr:DNA adenine methylase [Clostridium sp.]MCM1203641.1 DNA adenine methylase [Bacteroidales bacterium]
MYIHTDYMEKYGRIMQFNKNKQEPIHRWYSFVEGYSKEFIQSIISEMGRSDLVCLEPFSGSGTTALELQNNNIPCYSFEVNPLMYLIAKAKLENSYDLHKFDYWYRNIKKRRGNIEVTLNTEYTTLYEDKDMEKWNYNTEVGIAVEKLRTLIDGIKEDIYRDIFKVALAAILLDVSNLYRNGKCLSYKKDWKNKKNSELDVFKKFDDKIMEIRDDIAKSMRQSVQNNKLLLFNEDCRQGIEKKVKDGTIDLVITSPPYLNSRDYTDTYMLELKTLGFTKTKEEIRQLRERTFRSHVQIKWNDSSSINNRLLKDTLKELEQASSNIEKWNDSIIDMVRLYFVDMQNVFRVLFKKLKSKGRVYFNVSNSAYFNVLINTLEICASIAEQEGFKVIEVRDARKLKTSPQQKEKIDKLLEGVIVLER